MDATVSTRQAGYTASGGSDEITITGSIDDLGAPFTLQGSFAGGSAVFTYTPTDERHGSMSYQAAGGGATANGSGPYTITGEDGGPLTLTQTATGCAQAGGIVAGCRTSNQVITLTPR